VTRVDVIDSTRRAYTVNNASAIRLSLQDGERTLKIFLDGKPEQHGGGEVG
jgi:hypothetical protein